MCAANRRSRVLHSTITRPAHRGDGDRDTFESSSPARLSFPEVACTTAVVFSGLCRRV